MLEEREVIFAEDVEKIFGKRPWLSRADEILQEEEKAVNANKENVPANEEKRGSGRTGNATG